MTAISFNALDMNLTSTTVLWEGASSDLTNMATGGRVVKAGYKVTEDAVYFASGMLSNREEAVPLWAVRDVDLAQSITQRARGVGDLTLKLDPQVAADYGQQVLVLKAVKEPKAVRTIVLNQANAVRQHWNDRAHHRDLESRRAGAVNIGSVPAPAASVAPAGDDLMAKLTRLGEMKQAGLLSDDEFASAKAKLLS